MLYKYFFSESILDNSINLNDFSIEGIGTPTSWETGMSVDDNIFILKFNDFGDTSSTPKLNYTKGSLTDLSGKKLENISNNLSIDKSSPRVLNAEIFANNSGIFNKIEVNFSENINSTTDKTAFVLNNGLTINSVLISGNKAILNLDLGSVNTDSNGYNLLFTSNSFWKDLAGNDAGSLGTEINLADKAKPVLISYDILDTNGDFVADKVKLVLSENMSGSLAGFLVNSGSLSNGNLEDNKITFDISGVSGTAPNILLSYTGNLEDNNSNKLDNITNLTLNEKISPKIINSYTLDQSGNGKIDGIEIEFSEDINSDFSDFNIVVSGYSLNNFSTYTKNGNNKVIVSLNEKQIFDTEITPLISINLNSSLKDLSQNIILLQSNNTIDKVGPVIVGARFDNIDKKMYLDFSENISTNLNNSSFALSGATASIVNTTFSSGSNFAVLELNSTGIDIGVSEISFAGNSVGDMLGNKQLNTYFSKILGGVIINEIMSVGGVKYIELKNISSSSIDISNWTIKNALGNGSDYTIPASQTILANNYYLISTNNTYFSGITSNQIVSLNINSDIILKNGNIVIDSALYQVGENNTSLERLKNCGNGLSNICWYKAVGSEGFTNNSYKGTPKSDNILDVINPEITTNIVDNLILPIGNYDLKYNYNDNIGVNTGSINFKLEKWDGNDFVTNNLFTTGSVDLLKVNYILSGLNYGKYKATFSIKDTSGNTQNDVKIFYVDDFSFSLSTGSINLGELKQNQLIQAQDNVIVTIKTLGAGFDFIHNYQINELGDWDGNIGYGACEGVSCNEIQNYKSKVFSQTKELQTSGELKTYNYIIKYGGKIDNFKEAGNYQINNEYKVNVKY
ncbi:lamin tail domain-containing protein [Candidatus Gracilibacteria bacterium]|nr:lamin tail domain-containing protein [Candidatus Gracilibacteria bacterium]